MMGWDVAGRDDGVPSRQEGDQERAKKHTRQVGRRSFFTPESPPSMEGTKVLSTHRPTTTSIDSPHTRHHSHGTPSYTQA